ncbi:lipoate-protein ligase B [Melioribacter roseus P3M-2]|uniref:Octanoyltransferase n=1 Tax=Melioribacter roseus (strain DSM 23840 / JCM 17771 / VKM B-2668 / P3M-2) TaxID=1191523 RepID=I6YY72_MELRP|nr:lipoyl(octanoyl) transferase LipB [Melioribacter roseus]AFN75487.1 lipoate-protein ligase B [Melioribacter roseus P3M-2]
MRSRFYRLRRSLETSKKILNRRLAGEVDDLFFLLEHPHTYTLGKVADRSNLLLTHEQLTERGIKVYDIDRGGDITYHGPGQIVGYPIIDLKKWKEDTHAYLRNLEQLIINVCKKYGLKADRKEGLTGVWIEDRKIAAIGIKVSRWITMHGFAFNINTDLSLFGGIIPCGIKDKEVTSLQKETGIMYDIEDIKKDLLEEFVRIFDYRHHTEIDRSRFINSIIEFERAEHE